MTGAVYARTPNLGLGLIEFTFPNWADDANNNTKIIDAGFSVVGVAVKGAWTNSTPYNKGDLVVDIDLNNLWRCQINHTSAAAGTFEADRIAHPTYWIDASAALHARGLYVTGVSYYINDVVYKDLNKYVWAMGTTTFVGSTWDADVASGKLVVITDTTSAVNATATSAAAAASSATNSANSATASDTARVQAQTASANAQTYRNEAQAARDLAQGYAASALTYSNNASTFATNASNSATAAAGSATSASTSATNAAASAAAAAASAATFLPEAPSDGQTYGRKNAAWSVVGSTSMTGAQILAALAPVDGAGSGLDADTLDTFSSGDFVKKIGDQMLGHLILPTGPAASNAVRKDYVDAADTTLQTNINGKEPTIAAGTTAQYWRGDKSWQTLPIYPVATAEERNRLINGSFQISQEYTLGVAVTVANAHPADMWQHIWTTSGVPASVVIISNTTGIGNYLRMNSMGTVDASVAAGDVVGFFTRVEGLNIKDFGWGTSTAKPIVLRFTAAITTQSNFVLAVSIRNRTGSRSYVHHVTLVGGSAWEDFVIPIPGCTDGTWDIDTQVGLLITFCMMGGSTYASAASQDTWLTTNSIAAAGVGNIMAAANTLIDLRNVGLYLDPNNTGLAPPYQVPDYTTEYLKCLRYWQQTSVALYGNIVTAISYLAFGYLAVPPRPGVALSGVSTVGTCFPNVVGSLSMQQEATVSENRTSNATATFGRFITTPLTANARL